MADLSVIDSVVIEQQEALFIHLVKAEAMAHATMHDGFLHNELSHIYAYLWGLNDVISEARDLSEQVLSILLRSKGNFRDG